MKILAIESSLDDLKLLESCLAANIPDAEIHGFVNGDLAWEWCKNNQIDVVFASFASPDEEIDGAEGAEIARRLHDEGQCRNMVLCANEQFFSLDAWNMDASFFYLKPATNKKIWMGLQKLRYPFQSI